MEKSNVMCIKEEYSTDLLFIKYLIGQNCLMSDQIFNNTVPVLVSREPLCVSHAGEIDGNQSQKISLSRTLQKIISNKFHFLEIMIFDLDLTRKIKVFANGIIILFFKPYVVLAPNTTLFLHISHSRHFYQVSKCLDVFLSMIFIRNKKNNININCELTNNENRYLAI